MTRDEHYRKLEHMYGTAPNNDYYNPKLVIDHGKAELWIEIKEQFFHAAGAAHGSVYFKALDDACFFAANSLAEKTFMLTTSFNMHLLRPITGGTIHAVGKVVSSTRRLMIAEGELFDERGKLAGRGSGAFMPGNLELSEEIGYG